MSKPEFVYVTYIETTPERLWDALTESDFTKLYWFGTEVQSDWKVGSPFALVTNGTTTDIGEILESDPPRRLSYTFKHVRDPAMSKERASKVALTLQPFGKLVKLTLTHEDFAEGSLLLDGISRGWPAILSALKSLLEKGEALAIPPAALGIEGFA